MSPVRVLQLGPTVCQNLRYLLAHGFEDGIKERMSQEILAPYNLRSVRLLVGTPLNQPIDQERQQSGSRHRCAWKGEFWVYSGQVGFEVGTGQN